MRVAILVLACALSSCCTSHGPFAPAGETCPASPPAGNEPCSGSLRCEYGAETCCGQTHPSYVCECNRGGGFFCYPTDACLLPSCPCVTDVDCAWGAEWCEGGWCTPCDNSGLVCNLFCSNGFVAPRNGCQPCECAPATCTWVGSGGCGCGSSCPAGSVCEAGLGRCVEDSCANVDCAGPCDPLRGCIAPECATDADCRLVYSSCSCQAVPAASPQTSLDECLYDGGAFCGVNNCESGVRAVCATGLCVESFSCGDCRTTGCAPDHYCGECLVPEGTAWACLPNGTAC